MRPDPTTLIDRDRYPVDDLTDPKCLVLVATCRDGLASRGVAIVPGFLRAETVAAISAEAAALEAISHHQDLWGSPYLELPDLAQPVGHPRRAEGRSALTAIAYDDFPESSALRALYEWEPLLPFLAAALAEPALYRYDDPLGGLNVAAMREGDELAWHFDQTSFVVSIGLQSSEVGGDFECAARVRSDGDEAYDLVAAVLAGGAPERVVRLPLEPGTLMLFAGRHSLHRVTPIVGPTPRYVALLGYDTRPGTCSSELLRLVRYGRSGPRAA